MCVFSVPELLYSSHKLLTSEVHEREVEEQATFPAIEDAGIYVCGWCQNETGIACTYTARSFRALRMHQRTHGYQTRWRQSHVTNQCP
eukprot:2361077-Amphidinium_carterae.1